jgi:uncharacterized protein (TIGR03086 family)
MTAATTAVLAGGVALLERATGYTLGSLLLVTPDVMGNRTPCQQWDLRALLLHLNDSFRTLHEAIAVEQVGLDPAGEHGPLGGGHGPLGGGHGPPGGKHGAPAAGRAPDPAVDPAAAIRIRAGRMIGAWVNARRVEEISIADRSLSSGIIAATGAVEIAVHGWDVSRACGHDRPVPPALAEELLDLCQVLVGETDRPGLFAAPVPVPVSPLASPSDHLVAFLGRQP